MPKHARTEPVVVASVGPLGGRADEPAAPLEDDVMSAHEPGVADVRPAPHADMSGLDATDYLVALKVIVTLILAAAAVVHGQPVDLP